MAIHGWQPGRFSKPRSFPVLIQQMVFPIVLFFLMMALPESPRWHILKARRLKNRLRIERHYEAAFQALRQLRNSKVQAARDLIHIDAWIIMIDEQRTAASSSTNGGIWHRARRSWFWNTSALYQDMRCRRAMIAGLIVMALQQVCGVNVMAYYSSSVFRDSLQNCTYPCDIALLVCLITNWRHLHAHSKAVFPRLRHHQFWIRNSSNLSHR